MGYNQNKQRVRDNEQTKQQYDCMLRARTNLLKYKTNSTILWFSMFVDELLRVFRVYSAGQNVDKIKTNVSVEVEQVQFKYQTLINKIENIRENTGDQTLFSEMYIQAEDSLAKLEYFKEKAESIDEGTISQIPIMKMKTIGDKIKQTSQTRTPSQQFNPLDPIFKNKFNPPKMTEKMINGMIQERKGDFEIDLLVEDQSKIGNSISTNLENFEEKVERIIHNANKTQKDYIQKSMLVKKDLISFENKNHNKEDFSEDSHEGIQEVRQIKVKEIPFAMKVDIMQDQDEDALIEKTASKVHQNLDESTNEEILNQILIEDVLGCQKKFKEVEIALNKSNSSQDHDSNKSMVKLDLSPESNHNGEFAEFVNAVDDDGMEYLSLEINFAMINPEDFGFENFTPEDQSALEKKVQDYVLKNLQNNQDLNDNGIQID